MKYCSKCGNQLLDEAVICVKCGCVVDGKAEKTMSSMGQAKQNAVAKKGTWIPFVFGLIAILDILLFMLLGIDGAHYYLRMSPTYSDFAGLRLCGPLAIVSAAFYMRSKRKVFPILGLIFGCIQVIFFTIFYSYIMSVYL